jgi:cysteine desulfurase
MQKTISEIIYLDNNATTPCDPMVLEKMLPYFNEIYGNPNNGLHWQGRKSAKAIEESREQIASLIGARAKEIFFTSGATEGNNLSLLGFARKNKTINKRKIITSSIEHKSILNTCKALEKEGIEVLILPVSKNGQIQAEVLNQIIDNDTLMVSIQAANNETGTIQPIKELVEIAHSHGAIFHCDATQAIGKIPFDVISLDLDLVSFSSHKIYGPKGIGALFIKGGKSMYSIEPLWYGGGQERDLRPGTSNTPGIVGFGEACRLCSDLIMEESKKISILRNIFESILIGKFLHIQINGISSDRLPNTSNLTFFGVDADALILNAPRIMIGTGSACNSGAIEPSHVLIEIGLSREEANSSVRVSFGRFNNEKDSILAADELINSYQKLK